MREFPLAWHKVFIWTCVTNCGCKELNKQPCWLLSLSFLRR